MSSSLIGIAEAVVPMPSGTTSIFAGSTLSSRVTSSRVLAELTMIRSDRLAASGTRIPMPIDLRPGCASG
jgi:hypothetical protein